MFVILSCWDELDEEEKKLPLPEKIGLMLKHAGVSITITSFTDVIAFIIGSSTVIERQFRFKRNKLFFRYFLALNRFVSTRQQVYL